MVVPHNHFDPASITPSRAAERAAYQEQLREGGDHAAVSHVTNCRLVGHPEVVADLPQQRHRRLVDAVDVLPLLHVLTGQVQFPAEQSEELAERPAIRLLF